MRQALDFSGQVALITGASRGIGLATAKVLASYGATVVLGARTGNAIDVAAEQIEAAGGNAFAVACDVSEYASVHAAVESTLQKAGRLDMLVNAAGIIDPLSTLLQSDPELWAQAADINYKGVYFAMRAALPKLLLGDGGTIVNISSGAANSALFGWSHYCSSKAAAKKLTEVAHVELADTNVRVVGLSPGTVATGMMEKIRDANINAVSRLPWEQHIPPEWVGEAVAFLCGDGGEVFAGTDFSLKTEQGRRCVGLPIEGAPDG